MPSRSPTWHTASPRRSSRRPAWKLQESRFPESPPSDTCPIAGERGTELGLCQRIDLARAFAAPSLGTSDAINRPDASDNGMGGRPMKATDAGGDAGKQSTFLLASLAASLLVYVALAWAVFHALPSRAARRETVPARTAKTGSCLSRKSDFAICSAWLSIVMLPTLFWIAITRWNRLSAHGIGTGWRVPTTAPWGAM